MHYLSVKAYKWCRRNVKHVLLFIGFFNNPGASELVQYENVRLKKNII